jgi:nitric oxide reductase NorD protein
MVSNTERMRQSNMRSATRQALNEARQAGITPFVLTIDPQGNDYLRTMCDGLNYEVLDDINQLPARLLKLYRSLTS